MFRIFGIGALVLFFAWLLSQAWLGVQDDQSEVVRDVSVWIFLLAIIVGAVFADSFGAI